MEREDVLLLAGQIIGMTLRATAEDFEDAAESPGLYKAYAESIRRIAELRRMFEIGGDTEEGK